MSPSDTAVNTTLSPSVAALFLDGLEPLRRWLDAGWRPGAPPYDQMSTRHVWESFLGHFPADRPNGDLLTVGEALRALGWICRSVHRGTYMRPYGSADETRREANRRKYETTRLLLHRRGPKAKWKLCRVCGGSGRDPDQTAYKCDECLGKGKA